MHYHIVHPNSSLHYAALIIIIVRELTLAQPVQRGAQLYHTFEHIGHLPHKIIRNPHRQTHQKDSAVVHQHRLGLRSLLRQGIVVLAGCPAAYRQALRGRISSQAVPWGRNHPDHRLVHQTTGRQMSGACHRPCRRGAAVHRQNEDGEGHVGQGQADRGRCGLSPRGICRREGHHGVDG